MVEVRRFMVSCLTSVGVDEDKATQLADVLVAADNRGHYSHGINRLGTLQDVGRSSIVN